MRYKQALNTTDYLEFVLMNWERFKKANGGLCKAIKDVLAENKRLRAEIERLKGK